jgi:hypothetical protein
LSAVEALISILPSQEQRFCKISNHFVTSSDVSIQFS